MPWQPSCEYLSTNVTFYWSNTDKFHEDATLIGFSAISGSGYAAILFDFDILRHGSPVWFFARIIFNEGEINEHKVAVTSLKHSID